jgi:hypothetical protein
MMAEGHIQAYVFSVETEFRTLRLSFSPLSFAIHAVMRSI